MGYDNISGASNLGSSAPNIALQYLYNPGKGSWTPSTGIGDVNIANATIDVELAPATDGVEIYGSEDGGATQTVLKTEVNGALVVAANEASTVNYWPLSLNGDKRLKTTHPTPASLIKSHSNKGTTDTVTDNIPTPGAGNVLAISYIKCTQTGAHVSQLAGPGGEFTISGVLNEVIQPSMPIRLAGAATFKNMDVIYQIEPIG